jgi:hypothetical protein
MVPGTANRIVPKTDVSLEVVTRSGGWPIQSRSVRLSGVAMEFAISHLRCSLVGDFTRGPSNPSSYFKARCFLVFEPRKCC